MSLFSHIYGVSLARQLPPKSANFNVCITPQIMNRKRDEIMARVYDPACNYLSHVNEFMATESRDQILSVMHY